MLAASPMRAADRPAGSSLLTPPDSAGKVSVVRVDRRTGKLVRTVLGEHDPVSTKVSAPPARIQQLMEQSARAHQVDPLLVQSVMQVESNYNHYAVSPKGAEGLMQLMPGTARMLGVSNSFDPAQNIEAGVKYLKQLQDLYQDDRLALAAYNAGPRAVEKFKSIPPYAETQSYVDQVGSRYRAAKKSQPVSEVAPLPPTVAPAPAEEHPKLEQFLDDDGKLVLRTAP
jgi:hypothetical protein